MCPHWCWPKRDNKVRHMKTKQHTNCRWTSEEDNSRCLMIASLEAWTWRSRSVFVFLGSQSNFGVYTSSRIETFLAVIMHAAEPHVTCTWRAEMKNGIKATEIKAQQARQTNTPKLPLSKHLGTGGCPYMYKGIVWEVMNTWYMICHWNSPLKSVSSRQECPHKGSTDKGSLSVQEITKAKLFLTRSARALFMILEHMSTTWLDWTEVRLAQSRASSMERRLDSCSRNTPTYYLWEWAKIAPSCTQARLMYWYRVYFTVQGHGTWQHTHLSTKNLSQNLARKLYSLVGKCRFHCT